MFQISLFSAVSGLAALPGKYRYNKHWIWTECRGPEDRRPKDRKPDDLALLHLASFYDRIATCVNVLSSYVQLYRCSLAWPAPHQEKEGSGNFFYSIVDTSDQQTLDLDLSTEDPRTRGRGTRRSTSVALS